MTFHALRRARSISRNLLVLPAIFFMAMAAVSSASSAASPGWLDGNRIRLTVAPKGEGRSVTYGYTVSPGGDVRIEVEDRTGETEKSGEMLLVASRFLAARGFDLPRGYEIDTLDTAVLSWQLAGRILDRGAPGDPARMAGPVRIDALERRTPLSVSTTSAEETFAPPWSVRGGAHPLGGGRVFFDVTFAARTTAPPAPGAAEVRYSGTWEKLVRPVPLPDETSLSGWKVYALGPFRRKTSQGAIVDYGATPVAENYSTLGDLRRAAAAGK